MLLKAISLYMQDRSTFFYFMLYFTSLLAAYAVGISDADTNLSTIQNFEEVANCSVAYQQLTIPLTLDEVVLSNQKNDIENIIKNERQVILVYDPVLPINSADSMEAIIMGLHDNYFLKFFGYLKELQQTYPDFKPIIVIGSSINGQQTYSKNATQFIEVFRKLVLLAKTELNVNAYFVFSINPTFCNPIDLVMDPYQESIRELSMEKNEYDVEMKCPRNYIDYYPGDSFVDWIQIIAINENDLQLAQDIVYKGLTMVKQLKTSKPIMMMIGSRSDSDQQDLGGLTTFKNVFLLKMKELIEIHSETSKFFKSTIKAIIFENLEKNKDVSFFNSANGDIHWSTTGNNQNMYNYRALYGLFTDSSAIREFDPKALGTGSICGQGLYGDMTQMDCKPCQAGFYNNNTGQSECKLCPIGEYQDEPGAVQCKLCPFRQTTLHEGERLEQNCVCESNYYKDANGACIGCPKNYFSTPGGECVKCPADAAFSGSSGGSGQGCYCKKGYQWNGPTRSCIKNETVQDGVGDAKKVIKYTALGAMIGGLLWAL